MLTVPFMRRNYNPQHPGFLLVMIFDLRGMGGWPKGEQWFPSNQLSDNPINHN